MHKTRESLDKQQEALHCFSVREKGKYILDITQVDEQYHKVIGKGLSDWVHWNLPVVPYVT